MHGCLSASKPNKAGAFAALQMGATPIPMGQKSTFQGWVH